MILDALCFIFGIRERFGLEANPTAKRTFKLSLSIWLIYCLFLGFIEGSNGYELTKISLNMHDASLFQIWYVVMYESISTFGFFFVIGFIGAWIAYQTEIWEAHRLKSPDCS